MVKFQQLKILEPSSSMKICIDIDGVLAKTNEGFVPWFNEKHGTDFKFENLKEYSYNSFIGYDLAYVLDEINLYVKERWEDMGVYDGAIDVLKKMKDGGAELIVLTSRLLDLKDATFLWLKDRFGDDFFDEIIMYNESWDKEVCKSEFCEELGFDVILEDAPHYVEEIVKKEIPVLLMDQPWNSELEEGNYLKRVFSWDDIDKELEKLFLKVEN